jgi:hypothetical protein
MNIEIGREAGLTGLQVLIKQIFFMIYKVASTKLVRYIQLTMKFTAMNGKVCPYVSIFKHLSLRLRIKIAWHDYIWKMKYIYVYMIAREERYILKYIFNFNKIYHYLLLYLVNLEICLRRKRTLSSCQFLSAKIEI